MNDFAPEFLEKDSDPLGHISAPASRVCVALVIAIADPLAPHFITSRQEAR